MDQSWSCGFNSTVVNWTANWIQLWVILIRVNRGSHPCRSLPTPGAVPSLTNWSCSKGKERHGSTLRRWSWLFVYIKNVNRHNLYDGVPDGIQWRTKLCPCLSLCSWTQVSRRQSQGSFLSVARQCGLRLTIYQPDTGQCVAYIFNVLFPHVLNENCWCEIVATYISAHNSPDI